MQFFFGALTVVFEMSNLGDKLQRLRGQRSYNNVARTVECSVNALRDVEAGRTRDPGVQFVMSLARLYDVPLDWLVDNEQDWPPPESDETQAIDLIRSVLARGGLTGELSDDERLFISLLRSLPADLRQQFTDHVLGYAEGLRSGRTSEAARHKNIQTDKSQKRHPDRPVV